VWQKTSAPVTPAALTGVFNLVEMAQRLKTAPAMTHSVICDRAFHFAVRILKVCEKLFDGGPIARFLASQLMRCGTSIGANAEEAQEGQTKADYIAKMSISSKEARETSWWLRLATAVGVVKKEHVAWEASEANQLRMMIRSAIRTARSSSNRGW
jgi:four helix bundle protein